MIQHAIIVHLKKKEKKKKNPRVYAILKPALHASDSHFHCFHALHGMYVYTEATLSIHNIFSSPTAHVMCGMWYLYKMWTWQPVEGVIPPACITN